MKHFNSPRPVAWIFFIAALATTVGLGTWQVKRLQWKESVIAEIESAKMHAALEVLPESAETLQEKNFYPVELHGTWVEGNTEFHITPRWFKGVLGYFVIAPFTLEDGRVLMVNRGWVPVEKKDPTTRVSSRVKGQATIAGLLRTGDERNWLTPINQPERNLWFGRDALAMGAYGKFENVVPAMVDIVGAQDAKKLPVPSDGEIRLRNDHLSYILTWYGIALGIFIIFLVYHRK